MSFLSTGRRILRRDAIMNLILLSTMLSSCWVMELMPPMEIIGLSRTLGVQDGEPNRVTSSSEGEQRPCVALTIILLMDLDVLMTELSLFMFVEPVLFFLIIHIQLEFIL